MHIVDTLLSPAVGVIYLGDGCFADGRDHIQVLTWRPQRSAAVDAILSPR
jgi:hypothetical protein